MMVSRCLFALFALLVVSTNGLPLEQAVVTESESESPFRLASGMNAMAVRLFNLINSREKSNVVVSPFSIHTSISMLYYGTAIASETRRELSTFLGLDEAHLDQYLFNYLTLLHRYDRVRNEHDTDVQFANGLFVQNGLEVGKEYNDLLDVYYKTNVRSVDFSNSQLAADIINGFVEENTDNRIKELLSPSLLTSDTLLVLVNAVFFRAQWATPFDEHYTRPGLFHVSSTETFEHEAMMATDAEFSVADLSKELDARVLELPYVDNAFRMLVFLPNEHSHVDLLNERLLTFDFLADTLDQKLSRALVSVQLPRLRVSFKRDLVSDLKALDVHSVFNFTQDLAPIIANSNAPLGVTAVVHNADVEINEMGVVAAAATAQVIDTRSGYEVDTTFLVNRPFVVVIQDRLLKVPLFIARIVDPSGNNRKLQPLTDDQQVQLEELKDGKKPQEELEFGFMSIDDEEDHLEHHTEDHQEVHQEVQHEDHMKEHQDAAVQDAPVQDEAVQDAADQDAAAQDDPVHDAAEEDEAVQNASETTRLKEVGEKAVCLENGFMVLSNSDEDSVHFPCNNEDGVAVNPDQRADNDQKAVNNVDEDQTLSQS